MTLGINFNNMAYKKIILISLDTLRADGINFNQDKLYTKEYQVRVDLKKTKLDELCKKSCFFGNAISVAPYTSASHAAYFSGLWPKNNGLFDQFNSKLTAENIFQKFKKMGYQTIFKTDFPFVLGKYLNITQGVDHYFIEEEKKALKLLKEDGKILSFFHFGQIHYPYGFHSLSFAGNDYKDKVRELEKKYHIKTKKINLEDMAVETFRNKEDLDYLYRYKKIISHLYKNKLDDDLFNLYLEGINYFHENKFDHFLEQLLATLKGESYLIVIFADHGEAWNDETYGHHNSLDEGVIRVPMIFYADDIKAQYLKNRIRTIDLLPTLLELNDKFDDNLDGRSLVKMIYDHKIESDREAFSAVWVNESKDVVKNMKELKNKDKIQTKDSFAVKYSAAYYQKNYKYIENYKIFLDRSEKIGDLNRQILYKFDDLKKISVANNKNLSSDSAKKIDALNRIKKNNDYTNKGEQLRKYFNMQGYNI